MRSAIPAPQGLYNPDNERDACGVAFVAQMSGERSHGVEAVEAACRQALDLEVVDVVRIQRMLERRRAESPPTPAPASPRTPGRFARSAEDFRLSNPSPSEVTDDRV